MSGAGTILSLTEAYGMANAVRFAHLHALHSEACLHLLRRLQPRAFHHQPPLFFLYPICKRHGEERIFIRFPHRNGESQNGAPSRGVRNRGVVEAVGAQKELHKDLVQEEGDEGSGVAGRSREEGPQGRVAAGEGFHGHLQFRLHQQAGSPLRHSDLPHRHRNAAFGAEGRPVVRHGGRRHRFRDRQPAEDSEQVRPQPHVLHWELVGESLAEHIFLVRHGLRRRWVRHQLPLGQSSEQNSGPLYSAVPCSLWLR